MKRHISIFTLLLTAAAVQAQAAVGNYAFNVISSHASTISYSNSVNTTVTSYDFSSYSSERQGYYCQSQSGDQSGMSRISFGDPRYFLFADQPLDEQGKAVTRRFLGWYTKDGNWAQAADVTVGSAQRRLTGDLSIPGPAITNQAARLNNVPVIVAKYISLWDIATAVTPANAGTATGGGRFEDKADTTLMAKAATGYSFAKWSDNVTDNPRELKGISASATYTAVFTGNVYTVTFQSEGGEGTTPDVKATFTSALPTITVFPRRYGYDFDGYFDQQDGKGTRYYNADGTSAHAWDKAQGATLFAAWKAKDAELKIVFTPHITVIKHRIGESSEWITSTEDTTYLYPNGTKYEAYAEAEEGWSADYSRTSTKKGTVDYAAAEFKPVATEVIVTYKVTFHDPSGTYEDVIRPAVEKGTVVTPPDWSRTGHWLSWDPEIGPLTSDTTYNAVWTPQLYTVAFDSNGGSGTMTNVMFLRDTDCQLPSNAYVRTGYQYACWMTNGIAAFADGATVRNLAATGETNTLAAAWTANDYTVTFAPNPPAGETVHETMDPQAFVYDVPQALAPCPFTCGELWAFDGWRDTLNGRTYTNRETVVNLCATPNGTNRLEAIWKSDVGDLSVAMMGEGANLRWVDQDGGTGWTSGTDRSGNPCGKHMGEQALGATMTANLRTGGTLAFHWTPYEEYETLVITVDGVEVEGSPYGKGEQDIQVDVPEGAKTILIQNFNDSAMWGGSTKCESYITGMTWTPKGSEPKQGKPVVATAAGVADGVFSLTIPTISGIDYGVWTNADLTVPAENWGLMETRRAEGDALDFSFEIVPGFPQLFFRAYEVK